MALPVEDVVLPTEDVEESPEGVEDIEEIGVNPIEATTRFNCSAVLSASFSASVNGLLITLFISEAKSLVLSKSPEFPRATRSSLT
jgi:hypothetical protein